MSAFPFDAVIFDMDGVIVDTEYYYLGETAAFAKELGIKSCDCGVLLFADCTKKIIH